MSGNSGLSKLGKKIFGAAEWVVYGLSGLMIAYLSILVFIYSFNASDSIPKRENVLLHILVVGLLFIVLFGIGKLLENHNKLSNWLSGLFFVLSIVWLGMVSVSYVTQTMMQPGSDQYACHFLAQLFFNSDFGTVLPEGSYLSLWPFQTSFIFIMEKIMRVFQDTSTMLFQKINCFYLLLIVTAGYSIVCMITKRIEGRLLYLGIMVTYWPWIFRTTIIYGDLPGVAWMMTSGAFFLWYKKCNSKWLKSLCAIMFMGSTIVACLYKGNCKIYVIAVLLVTLVYQLKKKDYFILLVVLVTTVLSVCSTSWTQKYYEHYAQNTCGKGVPAIAYLAMGLQYNGEEAIPGGWNGFHSNTYMETGYDYEETVRISKESIANSVAEFMESPKYMLSFFHTKILKQWANQTHGVYWKLNTAWDLSRNPDDYWVQYFESGAYQKLLAFEDFHESLVYGVLLLGSLCVIWRKICKKSNDFSDSVFLVTFIGGFLFSLIWEGQTIAVMAYPVLLLPIAIGILCKNIETE